MTDQDVWDIYFSTIVGWQNHPGYIKSPESTLELDDCAQIANNMMEVRQKWLLSQQE